MWAFDADTRYLLPLLPAMLVALWLMIEPLPRHRLTVLAAMLALHLGVALGYWTAVEIPRGQRCNSQWAAVADFASDLKEQPGMVVATRQVPECARLMLSFLIDRPVLERAGPGGFPPARWILMPANDPDFPGFRAQENLGHYKLLVRDGGSR
jgi:hypothetical protein